MQVPEHLKYWLAYRTSAALRARKGAIEVDDWLDKHGVEVPKGDRMSGTDYLLDPIGSAERILKIVEEHPDN